MDANFQVKYGKLQKKLLENDNLISGLFLAPSPESWQQAIKLHASYIDARTAFLRDVADHWRKTGVRQVETVDVLMLGEPDISWIPEAVRHGEVHPREHKV